MLNLQKALEEDITAGLAAAGISLPDGMGRIVVERPQKEGAGHYATPVALALAKHVGKSPMDIVEAIATNMPKKEYIGKLEAAAPGFLNIWISNEWLVSRIDNVLEEDIYEDSAIGQGQHVNLEFISANPTGPLTLGNARTAFSADTLANILECAGFNVTREYYVNDAGNQIRRLGESVLRRALELQGEKIEFPDGLYEGEYIYDIAKQVLEQWKENEGKEFTVEDLDDAKLLEKISREAMEYCLAEIKSIVHDDLKIHMDVWTSEEAVRKSGKIEEVLDALRKDGHTYIKDGTEFLKTTQWGDEEDRVLVKKDGEYAYIAPDIAYHQDKFDRKFDVIFTFLGADHQGHVPKLMGAMKALGNDTSKLRFIVAQFLSIMRDGAPVKLSKRAGRVFGPQDLIEEIGYDAARFFLIQHSLESHMTLDLAIAKERSERNPVFYIQYAHVRLQSILRKAKEAGLIEQIDEAVAVPEHLPLNESSELALLRAMYGLPEVITEVSKTFDTHDLAYYAQSLAKAVHQFYREVPVLASQDKDLVASRLLLVQAASKVLGQTLDLLGISKPDVM